MQLLGSLSWAMPHVNNGSWIPSLRIVDSPARTSQAPSPWVFPWRSTWHSACTVPACGGRLSSSWGCPTYSSPHTPGQTGSAVSSLPLPVPNYCTLLGFLISCRQRYSACSEQQHRPRSLLNSYYYQNMKILCIVIFFNKNFQPN